MHSNRHNFYIRTNIDYFFCLIGRESDQAIITVGAITERGSMVGQQGVPSELFQECWRGNVLIGTLRFDKNVRFKRSKAIIRYITGRCCSKKYICSPRSFSIFLPHFMCLFLARGEKKISSPSD